MYPSVQACFPVPGSIVSIPIMLGYRHLGIVSDRFVEGKPMVISNSARMGGVTEESWDAFAEGQPVSVHRQAGGDARRTIARARSRIGTPYDLLKWNCEHLVSFAQGKPPESPQVNATITLAALGLLLAGFRGA